MTQAVLAQGTQLLRAGVAVLELNKLEWDGPEAAVVDATNSDSGDYREKIKGLLDAKAVTIEGNLILSDTTGQIALWNDLKTRSPIAFEIRGPTGLPLSFTFNGFVTNFKPVLPVAESKPAGYKAVIEITGEPTLSLVASGDLTGLACSVGTIVPAFSGSQYDYIDSLTNGTASVTVTATKAAGVLSLYVNDVFVQTLTTAVASGAITTPVGVTKVRVNVTESGKVTKSYRLNLGRAS